ncbi:hypothetical protein ACH5RR_012522 [Cinchona calisaya]|uniref:Uncharacterized protein n=1 Tax=Cinchona calisaya TaxID=153742 RepID=A0ABD3A7W8_9GENT
MGLSTSTVEIQGIPMTSCIVVCNVKSIGWKEIGWETLVDDVAAPSDETTNDATIPVEEAMPITAVSPLDEAFEDGRDSDGCKSIGIENFSCNVKPDDPEALVTFCVLFPSSTLITLRIHCSLFCAIVELLDAFLSALGWGSDHCFTP